ncbi:porin family protein [Mesonia sp. HuA40]|uniref:type IX secretion/gliding motility protein PorT/SprT n=1 Tax=Mesonia sp. HuA40 TaxID=2602761 RepID=UPI0011C78D8B|nr:porin family protein [Mesonia sp. HuA40]TXK73664.1 PorT family protein [Mesonia sp. HuA40]
MRYLLMCTVVFLSLTSSYGQGFFNTEKIRNKDNMDKQRWSWGYFLGFNSYGFDLQYNKPATDIVVKNDIGFNVGLLGNLRINDYIDLRLEPGVVFANRTFTYTEIPEDNFRDIKSTYIHVPLLVKFSTKRLNNFKPFVVGGVSRSINLSSNETNPDDNRAGEFRMINDANYFELGFGIDFYLPYFKFTPSIRGVFGMTDELKRDKDPNSPYTGQIESMKSRGIFINFTFQ